MKATVLQEGVTGKDRAWTHLQAGGYESVVLKAHSTEQGQKRGGRVVRSPACGRGRWTLAFSFLLWFLPSELSVFLMLSTVLQRRNGSQGLKECYPGHHFNSVIWDSSIPLTWLNYQTKDLVTPYTQDRQVQETSWQREQVYWRNDAIPSSHKTKIRKDI